MSGPFLGPPAGSQGNFTGASSILFWDGWLVLELRKPHKWMSQPDGTTLVGVGGIGGTIEEGESPLQGCSVKR